MVKTYYILIRFYVFLARAAVLKFGLEASKLSLIFASLPQVTSY